MLKDIRVAEQPAVGTVRERIVGQHVEDFAHLKALVDLRVNAFAKPDRADDLAKVQGAGPVVLGRDAGIVVMHVRPGYAGVDEDQAAVGRSEGRILDLL